MNMLHLRLARSLEVALLLILGIAVSDVFAAGENCSGINTRHAIYDMRVLESDNGCESEHAEIESLPSYWGSHVDYFTEPYPTDYPNITIENFYSGTAGVRVLAISSHGDLQGKFRVEQYHSYDAMDDAWNAYLENTAFDETDIYRVGFEGADWCAIGFRGSGIRDHLRVGHFANDAIVYGGYCMSAGTNGQSFYDDWQGNVTSFLGYETGVDGGVVCSNLLEIQKTMCCNRWVNLDWDVEAARRFLPALFVYGDSSNTYDCTDKCPLFRITSRVESLYADEGVVHWKVLHEEGTQSFRIWGSGNPEMDGWTLLTGEIESLGDAARYAIPVSGDWQYLKLEEKGTSKDGGKWTTARIGESTLPSPALQRFGRTSSRRPIIAVGIEEDSTALSEYVIAKRESGLQASFVIYPSIDRNLVDHVRRANTDPEGPLWIIISDSPRGGGASGKTAELDWIWPIRIAAPEDLRVPVEAYAAELRDELGVSVTSEFFEPPYDTTDVREFLGAPYHAVGGLLFGEAYVFDEQATTMPMYYLSDPTPDSSYGWWTSKLMSMAGYEHAVGSPMPVGFLPTRDTTEAWDYLYKRMDVGWNGTWYDYGKRLGAWVYDGDASGCTGEEARIQMRVALEEAHPDWQVDTLIASRFSLGPYTRCERTESLRVALSEGRSVVAMLSTGGLTYDYGNWVDVGAWCYDPDTAFGYSTKYSHLLSLTCMTNAVDHLNGTCPAEMLLHVPGGGAISSIGPSRGSESLYYFEFLRKFLQLQATSGNQSIGMLYAQAKFALQWEAPEDSSLALFCKTLVLLGDPTVDLISPRDSMYTSVRTGEGDAPRRLVLSSPVPNPFNPKCRVKYYIPRESDVRVTVYDVSGRAARVLVKAHMEEGSHEAVWDGLDDGGRKVGSGVYFIRAEGGGESAVVRAVLVR